MRTLAQGDDRRKAPGAVRTGHGGADLRIAVEQSNRGSGFGGAAERGRRIVGHRSRRDCTLDRADIVRGGTEARRCRSRKVERQGGRAAHAARGVARGDGHRGSRRQRSGRRVGPAAVGVGGGGGVRRSVAVEVDQHRRARLGPAGHRGAVARIDRRRSGRDGVYDNADRLRGIACSVDHGNRNGVPVRYRRWRIEGPGAVLICPDRGVGSAVTIDVDQHGGARFRGAADACTGAGYDHRARRRRAVGGRRGRTRSSPSRSIPATASRGVTTLTWEFAGTATRAFALLLTVDVTALVARLTISTRFSISSLPVFSPRPKGAHRNQHRIELISAPSYYSFIISSC